MQGHLTGETMITLKNLWNSATQKPVIMDVYSHLDDEKENLVNKINESIAL